MQKSGLQIVPWYFACYQFYIYIVVTEFQDVLHVFVLSPSSHAVTSDVDVVSTAKTAEYFLSDGIIVTGAATGLPAERNDVDSIKQATQLPVLVGSGVTANNVNEFRHAHGMIVGSHFKKGGVWSNPVDHGRICKFMRLVLSE